MTTSTLVGFAALRVSRRWFRGLRGLQGFLQREEDMTLGRGVAFGVQQASEFEVAAGCIGGAEGEQSGNCHFAGEHTSIDFQGYLNGAVATGQSAAGEILADFK